jgi:two-component system response regulator NreC
MPIRILIADDHQIFRQGLRNLVEEHPGMEVAGEADNGRSAVKLTLALSPDMVIIDVNMPGMNGILATEKIIHHSPQIKVIGLSFHSSKEVVQKMFQAGASAYLSKHCDSEEFIKAIKAVLENRKYVSSDIKDIMENHAAGITSSGSRRTSVLSKREVEQLQHMVNGIGIRESAAQLKLSVKTAETHRRNVKRKLGTNNLTELIRYAVRHGLTTVDENHS